MSFTAVFEKEPEGFIEELPGSGVQKRAPKQDMRKVLGANCKLAEGELTGQKRIRGEYSP